MPPKLNFIKKEHINYRGQNSVVMDYGKASHDDILSTVNKIRKEALNKGINGKYIVTVKLFKKSENTPAVWRNGSRFMNYTDKLEDLNAFDEYWGEDGAPEKYAGFQVTLFKSPRNERAGGKSYKNDCLYECLDTLIPTFRYHFPTPESLKNFLNIGRCSLINVTDIPLIEKVIKDYKINVEGEYISTSKAKREINLTLENEHYSIKKTNVFKARGIIKWDKKILLYRNDPNDFSYVFVTSGANIKRWSYERIKEIKSKHYKYPNPKDVQTTFLAVKCPEDGEDDLIKCWDKYYAGAVLLKEQTNGRYNLFRSTNLADSVKRRFVELNPEIEADELGYDEAQWIEKSSIGAFIWAEKGYEGTVFEYDYVSAYASILKDKNFFLPIKKGEFKKLTDEEFSNLPYFEYGIYRAKITVQSKLMKENKADYYTHYDLTRARELNYEIKLIQDENPNFLHYSKEKRVSGMNSFEKYIDELFTLKKLGFATAKQLLVMVWGVLVQQYKKSTLYTEGKELKIPDDEEIVEKIPKNKRQQVIKTVKNKEYFNTPYARLKPFILSKCRMLLSRTIESNYEYIVRVHTDGFLACKPLKFEKNVKLGSDIGNLKYKGSFEAYIVSARDVKKI